MKKRINLFPALLALVAVLSMFAGYTFKSHALAADKNVIAVVYQVKETEATEIPAVEPSESPEEVAAREYEEALNGTDFLSTVLSEEDANKDEEVEKVADATTETTDTTTETEPTEEYQEPAYVEPECDHAWHYEYEPPTETMEGHLLKNCIKCGVSYVEATYPPEGA